MTNTVDPGLGAVSAAVVVAMAAMFVAAFAVPDAFGSHGVLFGVAFLVVTVMYLALYGLSARRDPDLMAAILRIAPSTLVGALLIILAGFVDGGLKPILWLTALAVRVANRLHDQSPAAAKSSGLPPADGRCFPQLSRSRKPPTLDPRNA